MKIYDMKALGRETKTDRMKLAPKKLELVKEKSPVRQPSPPKTNPFSPRKDAELPPFKFQAGIDKASDFNVVKQMTAIIQSQAEFTDPEFPAIQESIGSEKYGNIEWKRLRRLYKEPKLFQEIKNPNGAQIKQGVLRNGGLVVVMNKVNQPG